MKTKSPGPASTTCSRRSPHRYLAVPSSTYRIVSWSPWWCAPVAAPGSTVLRKALSTLASGLRLSKATSRSSPGVCGVSSESWSRRTTRTEGLFIVVSFLSLPRLGPHGGDDLGGELVQVGVVEVGPQHGQSPVER